MMHDSESTSGKLSRALLEDLVLERDRLRTLYAELFECGGFPAPEFSRTIFALAKAEGMIPSLVGLARPWLGDPSPKGFEEGYLSQLQEGSTGPGKTSRLENALPVDFFDYVDSALEKPRPGETSGVPSDAAGIETLLRFLKSAANDPALVLFRKSVPEMPPSRDGGPALSAAANPSVPLDTPPEAGAVSRVVGPYQILEEIGRGGMGTVHLGYHTLLRKRFAIKILRNLPPQGEERERAVKRFTREARIYHELTHPNIVRLQEVFAHEGELLIVMEYVPGPNLRKVLNADRRLAPERVLRIGIDIGEALQAARAKDVIHRDPKPENILVTPDGRFKITDFGIARIVRETEETRVTEEKSVLGTVGYMSPEAVRGEDVDEQTDIYSLGAVLYHAATGLIPCYAPDPSSMMYHTLHKEPRAISVIVDHFPPALEAVILRCLKKAKGDRFAGYPELLDALYSVRKECEGIGAPGADEALPAPRRRAPAAIALVVLALAAIGLVSAVRSGKGPAKSPTTEGFTLVPTRVANLVADSPRKEANSGGGAELPNEKAVKTSLNPEASSAAEPREARRVAPPPAADEPPASSLRERLIASRPSELAVRRLEDILGCFERRFPEITAFSYGVLSQDLEALGRGEGVAGSIVATGADLSYQTALADAARKLVALAEAALRSRLAELASSSSSLSLKLRDGGTASGTLVEVAPDGLVLRDDRGSSVRVPLGGILPEELHPRAAPAGAELAFQALSGAASDALSPLAQLGEDHEEFLVWLPLVLRLARLEVANGSRLAGEAAREALLRKRPPESSTTALAHAALANAALGRILALENRITLLFPFSAGDFARAKREGEALELLFHGQLSLLSAAYRETASGSVGATVLLELFEQSLSATQDELLVGTGWFNRRWELRPWDKDPLARSKILVPGPADGPLVLQDPEGPRSLVMNDPTSRAAEGLLLRLKVEPLSGDPDRAEWRFQLVPERAGTAYLRMTRGAIELFHSTLTPGSVDERVSRVPVASPGEEPAYHSYALLPGAGHLHLFRDRELVLSIPRADGSIPSQPSITVYRAKASIHSFLAKQAPARGGEPRK